MSDATDVLQAIDQLRRDLSGYHGQLKAHDDLQRHCERQKEQLAALQAIHKPIKDERNLYKRQADKLAAENAKLRERIRELEMEGSDHFYRTAYAEDANRTLEVENAKLRELVEYMTPIAWYGASERERDRMRELGVEV